MNVAIIANGFHTWGGGIDFIYNIYRGFQYQKQDRNTGIFLFVPREQPILQKLKKHHRSNTGQKQLYDVEALLQTFKSADLRIVYYDKVEIGFLNIVDKAKGLNKQLRKYKIDVCIPVLDSNLDYTRICKPYVSYIYDFQHKKLPELFSETDRNNRDIEFQRMVDNSNNILVGSEYVKNDVIMYCHPKKETQIYTLPYDHICDEQWIDMNMPNKYGRFFIISNQFWKHKDHLCAFKALEKLYEKGYDDVKLICTGKLGDDRDSEYAIELRDSLNNLKCKSNIILTGYVSKEEQIGMMKNAVALIQPTRFEGDQSGAVYNALSLCRPCIVSDFPTMQEIPEENDIMQFRMGNSDELCKCMEEELNRMDTKYNSDKVRKYRSLAAKHYSEFMYEMAEKIIKRG